MNMEWSMEDDPASMIGAETEVGHNQQGEEDDPGEYVGTPNDYDDDDYEDAFEDLPEVPEMLNPPHTPKPQKSDFEILVTLGVGGYGRVYQVRKATGVDKDTIFAMKVLEKSKIVRSGKDTAHTKSERSVLAMAKHPFIVDMKYAFQDATYLYMVLDFCQGGELFSQLEKTSSISEDVATFYLAEIALALGHLHSMEVIYRDLKPENILLTAQGHVKLTDFGLCKESIGVNDRTHTFCGTIDYMAPEIIHRHGHDKSVDWWSLGTLLFDMVCGMPPFTSNNRTRTLEKIKSGKVTYPHYLTHQCRSLLKQLIKRDPKARLGSGPEDVEAIKAHPFFRNIEWDKLLKLEIPSPAGCPQFDSAQDTKAFASDFLKETPRIHTGPADTAHSPVWFEDFSYCSHSFQQQMMRSPRKTSCSPSQHGFSPAKQLCTAPAGSGRKAIPPAQTVTIGFNVPGETPQTAGQGPSGICTTTASLVTSPLTGSGYSAAALTGTFPTSGLVSTDNSYAPTGVATVTNGFTLNGVADTSNGFATIAACVTGAARTNGCSAPVTNGFAAAATNGFAMTTANGFATTTTTTATNGFSAASTNGFATTTTTTNGFAMPTTNGYAAAAMNGFLLTTTNAFAPPPGFPSNGYTPPPTGYADSNGCASASETSPSACNGSAGRRSPPSAPMPIQGNMRSSPAAARANGYH